MWVEVGICRRYGRLRLARGGREVAQVGRDDRLRIVRRHGRREHVAVGGLVRHPRLERGDRQGRDLGVLERAVHGVNQLCGLPGRPAIVVHEVPNDLIEDPSAPTDLVEVLLGATQQRVPQWQRVQNARIEENGKRHTPTIGGGTSATEVSDSRRASPPTTG